MKWIGGGLVFAAEILMYVGVFWWCLVTVSGVPGLIVAVGVTLALASFWAVFLSPKAPRKPRALIRLFLRSDLLVLGALAWWGAGYPGWGIATVAMALVGTLIDLRWPVEAVTERYPGAE